MKTIAEEVSLHGKSEEITISELRKRPGDIFQQVELGKRFSVTKNGKVIAAITRPENTLDVVVNSDGRWHWV